MLNFSDGHELALWTWCKKH